MTKFKLTLALLITTVFLITGCGGSSTPVNKKIVDPKPFDTIVENSYPAERPNWTYTVESAKVKYPELELFIGESDFAENEFQATKEAETNAIDQIIKYKGIYVESEFEMKKSTTTTNEKSSVTVKTKTEINQIAKNYAEKLRILDKYVENGNVYEPRGIWKAYTKVIVLYGIDKDAL
jgi:hypothetical protein